MYMYMYIYNEVHKGMVLTYPRDERAANAKKVRSVWKPPALFWSPAASAYGTQRRHKNSLSSTLSLCNVDCMI